MEQFYPNNGTGVNSPAYSSAQKVANVSAHLPSIGIIRNSVTLLMVMEQIQLHCRKRSVFCKGNDYLAKRVKPKGKPVGISTIGRALSRLQEMGAIQIVLYPGLLREIIPLVTVPECRQILESLSVPSEILDRKGVIEKTASRSEGFIYLIKSGAIYKIGRTKKFTQRISAIQTGNPNEIEYIASYRTGDAIHSENHWHIRFASRHVRGEWFSLTPEQVEEFKNHCAKKEDM